MSSPTARGDPQKIAILALIVGAAVLVAVIAGSTVVAGLSDGDVSVTIGDSDTDAETSHDWTIEGLNAEEDLEEIRIDYSDTGVDFPEAGEENFEDNFNVEIDGEPADIENVEFTDEILEIDLAGAFVHQEPTIEVQMLNEPVTNPSEIGVYEAEVELELDFADPTPATEEFEIGNGVVGTVTDPYDEPIDGVDVEVWDDQGDFVADTETNADGEYAVDLDEGEGYTIQFDDDAYVLEEEEFDVGGPGDVQELNRELAIALDVSQATLSDTEIGAEDVTLTSEFSPEVAVDGVGQVGKEFSEISEDIDVEPDDVTLEINGDDQFESILSTADGELLVETTELDISSEDDVYFEVAGLTNPVEAGSYNILYGLLDTEGDRLALGNETVDIGGASGSVEFAETIREDNDEIVVDVLEFDDTTDDTAFVSVQNTDTGDDAFVEVSESGTVSFDVDDEFGTVTDGEEFVVELYDDHEDGEFDELLDSDSTTVQPSILDVESPITADQLTFDVTVNTEIATELAVDNVAAGEETYAVESGGDTITVTADDLERLEEDDTLVFDVVDTDEEELLESTEIEVDAPERVVDIMVRPPGDGSFATDDEVEIVVGTTDESGFIPEPLGDEEITIEVDWAEDSLTSVQTTDERGLAELTMDLEAHPPGEYTATATADNFNGNAELTFISGPSIELLQQPETSTLVGEDIEFSGVVRDGEFGTDDAEVEVSIDLMGDTLPEWDGELFTPDEDGLIEFEFIPEQAGVYELEFEVVRDGEVIHTIHRAMSAGEAEISTPNPVDSVKAGSDGIYAGFIETEDGKLANEEIALTFEDRDGNHITDVERTTDDSGFFFVEYPVPGDAREYINVNIDIDDPDTEIIDRISITQSDGPVFGPSIDLELDSTVAPGQSDVTLEMTALDNDGDPVSDAELDVFIGAEYANPRTVDGEHELPMADGTVTTDEDGEARFDFDVPEFIPDGVTLVAWAEGELPGTDNVPQRTATATRTDIKEVDITPPRFQQRVAPGESGTLVSHVTTVPTDEPVADIPQYRTGFYDIQTFGTWGTHVGVSDAEGVIEEDVTVPADVTPFDSIGITDRYFNHSLFVSPNIEFDGELLGLENGDEVEPGETIELELEAGEPAEGILLGDQWISDELFGTPLTADEETSITVPETLEIDELLEISSVVHDGEQYYMDVVYLDVVEEKEDPAEFAIETDPTELAFPDTTVGSNSIETVTVENTGSDTMTIDGIAIEGADADAFSVNATGFELEPDEEAVLGVEFSPDEAESFEAMLVLEDTDAGESESVQLSGTGEEQSSTAPTTGPAGDDETEDDEAEEDDAEEDDAEDDQDEDGTEATVESESESDESGASVESSVEDAPGGERVDVEVPEPTEEQDYQLDSVSVAPTEDSSFSLNIETSSERFDTTPDAEFEFDGTTELGHLSVDTDLDNDAIDETEFTFRVREEQLDTLESSAEDVSLYRHDEETGAWEEHDTEVLEQDNGDVLLRTTADGFSDWTAAAKTPELDITDTEIDVAVATTDEDVTIQVFVSNTGGADGTYEAQLLANEEIIEREDATVPSNQTVIIDFVRTFEQPDLYEVQVNDVPVGEVNITEEDEVELDTPASDDADPGDDAADTDPADEPTDEADDGGFLDGFGPGFGFASALAALLGGGFYLRRRADGHLEVE